ncbi:MAG TPA: penicillin-binding transpeptidase domain-containing protein [Candidatus Bathyarchaeia archaeon]|nr:penicillin-binding transpeptidase domain-containing protein [Candidatus Bathyarchaeia archaeon]
MKKRYLVLSLIVAGLVASTVLFWETIQDAFQSDGKQAKAAFERYTANWQAMNFSEMYEQLSTETKAKMTKEMFIKRYQNIYDGIEAKQLQIEPIFSDQTEPDETGKFVFDYRVGMHTFIAPLSFTGKVTMVKEKQTEEKDWYIQWNPSFIFPEMEEGDKVRAITLEPQRGEILDHKGRVLATNRTVADVGITPARWKALSIAQQDSVRQILELTDEQINSVSQAEASRQESFIRLATVPEDDMRMLALEKINGLVFRNKQVRFYPYSEAFAHLIGYVGAIEKEQWEQRKQQGYRPSDIIGKTGLEKLEEERLRGSHGGRISIIDAKGVEKKRVQEKPAKDGETIRLTIDADVQQALYEEIQQDAGTAAAIHPMTGEVLALVSSPSFDPNAFVLGLSSKEWNRLNEDPRKPLLNRFAHAYAPGSTFKPLTAVIGLETGAIIPQIERQIRGLQWQKDSSWGDYTVTRVSDHGAPVNLQQALIYSDNIYFAQAALEIGKDRFLQEAGKFGFSESIPVAFPMERSTLVNKEMKNEIQLADSGYGQGEVSMTPLHLALVYSAFVNNGNMVHPSLFKEEQHAQYWKSNVMSPETAALLKQHLLSVTEDARGTGRGARVPGIRIAGKTGTAELKRKKGELGQENGWYVATNVDHPRLLVAMMVEDVRGRGGSHYLDSKIKQVFTKVLK